MRGLRRAGPSPPPAGCGLSVAASDGAADCAIAAASARIAGVEAAPVPAPAPAAPREPGAVATDNLLREVDGAETQNTFAATWTGNEFDERGSDEEASDEEDNEPRGLYHYFGGATARRPSV